MNNYKLKKLFSPRDFCDIINHIKNLTLPPIDFWVYDNNKECVTLSQNPMAQPPLSEIVEMVINKGLIARETMSAGCL